MYGWKLAYLAQMEDGSLNIGNIDVTSENAPLKFKQIEKAKEHLMKEIGTDNATIISATEFVVDDSFKPEWHEVL